MSKLWKVRVYDRAGTRVFKERILPLKIGATWKSAEMTVMAPTSYYQIFMFDQFGNMTYQHRHFINATPGMAVTLDIKVHPA
jgi:hypothetical protein